MTTYRLHEIIVTPVLVAIDESGEPIRKEQATPVAILSLEGLRRYADEFPRELATLNNGHPEGGDNE